MRPANGKPSVKGMDAGVHRAATVGLIESDGGAAVSSSRAAANLRATSRAPAEFIAKVQPFVNATAVLSKLAWAKTIFFLLTGIPVLRLLLFILASCALALYILLLNLLCPCFLRSEEWVDFWYSPIRWACRFGLFLCGFWWIEEHYPEGTSCWDKWACLCCGPRYLRNRAIQPNIYIGNHTTFMDALLIGSRVLPTAVGKADIVKMPILGPVIARLNPILVPRTAEDKARLPPVMDQLIRKARAGINNSETRGRPLVIFPEGTTVNQRHVCQFQRGAFVPGVPLRPIAIEYPFCMLDVCNSPDVWNATIWGRQLCSLYNRVKITYLPVYTPNEEEAKDPKLYAEGVRLELAYALGRTLAPHTDRDALLVEAAKGRFQELAPYTVACVLPSLLTRDIEAALRLPLRLSALAAMIDVFFLCDSTGDGYLRREDLSAWAVNFLLPVMEGKGVNLLAKDLRAKGKGSRGRRSSVIAPASCASSSAVAVADTPGIAPPPGVADWASSSSSSSSSAPGLATLSARDRGASSSVVNVNLVGSGALLSGERIVPYPAYVDSLFTAFEAARSAEAIDNPSSLSSSSSAPKLMAGTTSAPPFVASTPVPVPSPNATGSDERKLGERTGSRSGSFLALGVSSSIDSLSATLQRKASIFLQEAASGHLGGTPTDEHIMAMAAAVASAQTSDGASSSSAFAPGAGAGVGGEGLPSHDAYSAPSLRGDGLAAVADGPVPSLPPPSSSTPGVAVVQASPRGVATGWGAFRAPNARGLLSVRDIVSALALVRYGDGKVANSNFTGVGGVSLSSSSSAASSSASTATTAAPGAPATAPASGAAGSARRNVSFAGAADGASSSTSSSVAVVVADGTRVENQLRIAVAASSSSSSAAPSPAAPAPAAGSKEEQQLLEDRALGLHGYTGLTPVTDTDSLSVTSGDSMAALSPGTIGVRSSPQPSPSPAVPAAPLPAVTPTTSAPAHASTAPSGSSLAQSHPITRAQLIVAVGVLALREPGVVDMQQAHRVLRASHQSHSHSHGHIHPHGEKHDGAGAPTVAAGAQPYPYEAAQKSGTLSLAQLESLRVASASAEDDPTVRAVVNAAAELVWAAWGLGPAAPSSSSSSSSAPSSGQRR